MKSNQDICNEAIEDTMAHRDTADVASLVKHASYFIKNYNTSWSSMENDLRQCIITGCRNGWLFVNLYGSISMKMRWSEFQKSTVSTQISCEDTSTQAINNHTCPTCKNTRCSKNEKSCWLCGNKL